MVNNSEKLNKNINNTFFYNFKKLVTLFESNLNFIILLLIVLFPTLEIITRRFNTGIKSSDDYMSHLLLLLTFLGGLITSREKKHLSLFIATNNSSSKIKKTINTFTSTVSVTVCSVFAWLSITYIPIPSLIKSTIGFIPTNIIISVIPIGFIFMGLRFILQTNGSWKNKLISSSGILIAIFLGFGISLIAENTNKEIYEVMHQVFGLLLFILILSGILGTPIFIVLGGIAQLLFMSNIDGETPLAVIDAGYGVLTNPNSILPALPLFSLAGFILSESKAGERLVKLFKSLFSWIPGGMAIMTIIICTFFTALTGASGVTILALGGILSYVLLKNKYDESYTTGILTVNGIGSLFPPSLPIIMYAVVAHIDIRKMFTGVIIPGTVMVVSLIIMAIIFAIKKGIKPEKFNIKNAKASLKESFGEILLPLVIMVPFFSGYTRLVETGAVAVLYVIILEVFIHKDISLKKLPEIFIKCIPMVSGVLLILAMANGLSSYIVDAEIPQNFADWMILHIESKYLFLILLNIALLLIGCFMDVYSAIAVVVPLIIPIATKFGINPVHLGVIFLANLEIGYLTPPVGINLFFASYRFNKPLSQVYKDVVPFLITMAVALLFITYIPWFSTVLVDFFFK